MQVMQPEERDSSVVQTQAASWAQVVVWICARAAWSLEDVHELSHWAISVFPVSVAPAAEAVPVALATPVGRFPDAHSCAR